MAKSTTSRRHLARQLIDLGVEPAGVLLVHCSLSRVGPVEGGPGGLITALTRVLGPRGTLVMPSMTGEEDHPFDPGLTPCRGMGIVADTFWREPGVLRSDSPHAFAARGPQAARITRSHPLDPPHGLDSPVGRVHELDGQVLLLGVGHEADTTIHLAENLAGVRYSRAVHVTILIDGQPKRFDYREIDHCCRRFALVDGWLEARGLQRRGPVGRAETRVGRSRDLVTVVCEQLRQNETVFLHPFGIDDQCDEARASLGDATGLA